MEPKPTIDFEEIFEKAEVGIALNDPEQGTVGLVNERYAELMGYDRDELREMEIDEISADDPSFDQAAAMAKIEQALEGRRQQFDWLFERKDGSRFWGEVVLRRTSIGEVDRLLAFVRDIGPRKRYEQELERQNERLDEFTSVVSHDLRNPLSVATGRLELTMEDCESSDLDRATQALGRMDALIEETLTLARAGRTVGEQTLVELAALAEQCWRSIETADARLIAETDATVRADESRLRQLKENLFSNAVEHGGDAVTVRVGNKDSGFFVADDGAGIPEEAREDVFDVGFSTANDGTGFGLNIVREIAEAHGWDIAVTESAEGGARFEFTGVETTGSGN